MASDAESPDDDLFEFDELAVDEAEVSPEEAAAAALAELATVGDSLAEAEAAGHGRVPMGGAPFGALPEPPLFGADQSETEDFEDGDHRPVVVQSGMPPIVVPLLLLMVVANLALVGLTWKSMGKPDQPAPMSQLTGTDPAESITYVGQTPDQPTHVDRALRNQLPELTSSRDDAWAVLEEAQRAIGAGEFIAARRSLYSMLTVIDRIGAADRTDLESRAGYLVAESYRLQAQALGQSAKSRELAPLGEPAAKGQEVQQ